MSQASGRQRHALLRLVSPLQMTLAGCGVFVLSAWLLPLPAVVAMTGCLVCAGLGLLLAQSQRPSANAGTSPLETPFLLAQDAEIYGRYRAVTESLLTVSRNPDPIYREMALKHLDDLARQVSLIAGGTFVFEGTETWRILYEQLLRSPGLHLYRSVAWVNRETYWQDEPGRKSMAVNFELHDAERLNIERIVIIADELWPTTEVWPAERLRQWLSEQHRRGIWIKFVRASALSKEPELIADLGLYGSRAVGIQELDDECRTTRFTLTFQAERIAEVETRWNRLSIYAESFADYLDRYELP
jgi:hypothetical protein